MLKTNFKTKKGKSKARRCGFGLEGATPKPNSLDVVIESAVTQ